MDVWCFLVDCKHCDTELELSLISWGAIKTVSKSVSNKVFFACADPFKQTASLFPNIPYAFLLVYNCGSLAYAIFLQNPLLVVTIRICWLKNMEINKKEREQLRERHPFQIQTLFAAPKRRHRVQHYFFFSFLRNSFWNPTLIEIKRNSLPLQKKS